MTINKTQDEWEDFDHKLKLIVKRKKEKELTGRKIDKFCNGSCMENSNFTLCGKGCRNKINIQKEYFYKKLDSILLNIY